ncbi:hypothetical protein ACWNT8_14865 [Pigmentibacter ruber]|uniref:hypothetical protein n=1 Tax=Pigmentibacter ruber TaxID=2683196 RepID=UPI00131CC922|nr:hypothetical protein [Pigmentibacter ruber]BFD31419.1 hypothetical protein GTC16762_10370 [Pigmentibacter ruber]
MVSKNPAQSNPVDVSYELYRELAGEICAPLDDFDLTIDLRYELYTSKLTYLYNIQEQCFRCINSQEECNSYTQEDLVIIQNAIEVTKEFIRQTIRESLQNGLTIAEKKALDASRNKYNS